MKLVTFSINKERNLIVEFPVFVQPYIQQQLILYQVEMVPVPITDQNKHTHSYTHLPMDRPYITLNFEKHQKLRTCKNIGYEFYCKELFVVKHKSKYNCENVIFFDLGSEIIKENCNLHIMLTKLTSNQQHLMVEIRFILVNWPNNKHIPCNINNDIPVKISSLPYV